MDRVFLDANVLFSAAYRPQAGLLRLWHLSKTVLLTSDYALNEARINLEKPEQRVRLEEIIRAIQIVQDPAGTRLPKGIDLPEKDRPILLAAIQAKSTHLITGDIRDFGPYFGSRVEGVLILPPAEYLKNRE